LISHDFTFTDARASFRTTNRQSPEALLLARGLLLPATRNKRKST
jgi:hypothetical protein